MTMWLNNVWWDTVSFIGRLAQRVDHWAEHNCRACYMRRHRADLRR